MYISKKILSILLLLLSFIFGAVYATSSISGLTESVGERDIITAEYYNNLNGSKSEGKFCKYSGGKLVCIDDISSGGVYHNYGILNHNSVVSVPTGFTKTDCSFIASAAIPMEMDGAYKRSRHYSGWYEDVSSGWKVLTGYRSINGSGLGYVTNGKINYLLICSK